MLFRSRIAQIDIGLANNTCFLSQATIASKGTTVEISQNYSVEIMDKGELQIINLLPTNIKLPLETKITPQDEILELVIKTKTKKSIFNQEFDYSVFQIKKALIKNSKYPVILDNTISIATPVEIGLLKKKLSIIVGRNRNF